MKNYVVIILLMFLFSGCSFDSSALLEKKIENNLSVKKSEIQIIEIKEFPLEKKLEVSFVMQAPFANWSIHNESCEEAGILLAHYYYSQETLTKSLADAEILDMVRFQIENYGGEYDIYAREMGKLAHDYYGYDGYRVIDGTVDNIKNEIINGNPVIVPTTAAYLKSEKNDYPEMGYHVVVVVGYNQYGFVTHDVGTVTGEDFIYSYNTLQNSIKDYNNEVLVLK